MTGCAPAELLGGGPRFFDALVDRAREHRRLGWETNEMLAALVEVCFAMYRALLALGAAEEIPDQLHLPRPGAPAPEPERKGMNWRELQQRLKHG